MANEKHPPIPAPWEIRDIGHTNEIIGPLGESAKYILGYIKFTGDGDLQEANRNKLLQAVNNHDAMYEALKSAKEMIDNMCDEYLRFVGADSKAFDNIEFMAIEAALAAANPEK